MKNLRIPYGQAVHDEAETAAITSVLNEKRTIMGRETQKFEKSIAKLYSKKYGVMVNSGSSANQLAIEILNLPKGSEVITPLLTFSTTVAPIVKNGLIPVFIDVVQGQYIIDVAKIEKMITKKTKALMIPLLLGNVPDMQRLAQIAKKHNLYFIEDSCDTLGAKFEGRPTGHYSDISTTSFYGSHIITAGGGGGMVMVNRQDWKDRLNVLRGWGRTSSLFAESESLDKRYKFKLDGAPYDAKFIFDEIGYNYLPMEMGSAFGNVQLKKLPKFSKTREKNFNRLLNYFKDYQDFFILPLKEKKVDTQWLAFPLTIKKSAPFDRYEIVKFLEGNNIQTRPIFTGNILKQPGFRNIPHKLAIEGYRVTNDVMKRGFVFGSHHGLSSQQIYLLLATFERFFKKYKKNKRLS